jgi:cytosine permease
MSALKDWWTLDEAAERESADNPLGPLTDAQRRGTGPLLTLAFGWGFLITGLLTGGALGAGLPFYPDLIQASFLGNLINFVIGALVGYMAYQTACNSGLLYRFVYGNVGAAIPVLFIALLTIGWQGITVGAFGYAWTQSFDSPAFYAVAIFAGLLYTATTYFGVKGLERVSIPATLVLVVAGLYAVWFNVNKSGGWSEFLALSTTTAAAQPISMVQAINIVVGSWIVGAVVMAEYARFARKAWVAIAIPFIVLIIAQWFLQVVGALGSVVSGVADFTTYMREQGLIVAGLGLIGMSLALWTTGDANLYLPVIQTSSVFRRPRRVMVVICGLLGTLLGLNLYQHFLGWIGLLANLVPPLIGPVIADYYVLNKRRFHVELLDRLPAWNPAAFIGYVAGAASTFFAPEWIVASLLGLAVSMVAYLAAYGIGAAMGVRMGHAKAEAENLGG